jgi:hypothetical protein
VTTSSAHEFFAASAGVAGALIGLLFVAISVAPERVLGPDASEVHSVRAAATLTAFTNALSVSLFGLVPELNPGGAATAVGGLGLVFILGALSRLIPSAKVKRVRARELSFLIGLVAVFVIQLISGIELLERRSDRGALETVCILVVVCFLIGIERAWELVGGPKVGLWSSMVARHESHAEHDRDL